LFTLAFGYCSGCLHGSWLDQETRGKSDILSPPPPSTGRSWVTDIPWGGFLTSELSISVRSWDQIQPSTARRVVPHSSFHCCHIGFACSDFSCSPTVTTSPSNYKKQILVRRAMLISLEVRNKNGWELSQRHV